MHTLKHIPAVQTESFRFKLRTADSRELQNALKIWRSKKIKKSENTQAHELVRKYWYIHIYTKHKYIHLSRHVFSHVCLFVCVPLSLSCSCFLSSSLSLLPILSLVWYVLYLLFIWMSISGVRLWNILPSIFCTFVCMDYCITKFFSRFSFGIKTFLFLFPSSSISLFLSVSLSLCVF